MKAFALRCGIAPWVAMYVSGIASLVIAREQQICADQSALFHRL
jgi:hypothetical protein